MAKSTLARWCIAIAMLVGATEASLAQSVDCSTGGNLQTALTDASSGATITVTGTCSSGPYTISVNGITLNGSGSPTIQGQIDVTAQGVTLNGLIIDGSGVTASSSLPAGGVIASSGSALTITNCTIENWSVNGVLATASSVAINGGTFSSNSLAGLDVRNGTAVLGGFSDFSPVTLTGNGTGINVEAGGSVEVFNGTIEDNTGDGVDATDRSSIIFETTGGSGATITENDGAGLDIEQGSHLTFVAGTISSNGSGGVFVEDGSNASIGSNVVGGTGGTFILISNNGSAGTLHAGAGVGASGSTVTIDGATISSNTNGTSAKGAGIVLIGGSAVIRNANVSSESGLAAIETFGAGLLLQSANVTGPGNASALEGVGSQIVLLSSTFADDDATDPVLVLAGGSVGASDGGNTICAGTLGVAGCEVVAGGTAITVENASTFRQVFGSLNPSSSQAADTITGAGFVQVESNAELGTGASAPSTWTTSGSGILVEQNSSFRMDGGMTITGSVVIEQASNGFFNTNNGGTNVVSGGVTCPWSTTPAAHVSSPAKVLLSTSGSSAVTIGSSSSGQCLGF